MNYQPLQPNPNTKFLLKKLKSSLQRLQLSVPHRSEPQRYTLNQKSQAFQECYSKNQEKQKQRRLELQQKNLELQRLSRLHGRPYSI